MFNLKYTTGDRVIFKTTYKDSGNEIIVNDVAKEI